MNDEFVASQARAWGASVARREDTFDTRVTAMCERAWGRTPSQNELDALRAFFDRQSAAYGIDSTGAMNEGRVWSDLAQVLFMAKEFIFVG
jgi:hypothetical protein